MKPSDQRAFESFDNLPASAGVRLPVVAALFGISSATVWRWTKSDLLPKSTRVGRVTSWNVGELRSRLKASESKGSDSETIDVSTN